MEPGPKESTGIGRDTGNGGHSFRTVWGQHWEEAQRALSSHKAKCLRDPEMASLNYGPQHCKASSVWGLHTHTIKHPYSASKERLGITTVPSTVPWRPKGRARLGLSEPTLLTVKDPSRRRGPQKPTTMINPFPHLWPLERPLEAHLSRNGSLFWRRFKSVTLWLVTHRRGSSESFEWLTNSIIIHMLGPSMGGPSQGRADGPGLGTGLTAPVVTDSTHTGRQWPQENAFLFPQCPGRGEISP